MSRMIYHIPHKSFRWRHNGRDGVSYHQPHDCLLNRLFIRRSKKTSKLRVSGLFVGNSPGTGGFSAQMVSNAEIVSISWRHHVMDVSIYQCLNFEWTVLVKQVPGSIIESNWCLNKFSYSLENNSPPNYMSKLTNWIPISWPWFILTNENQF